MKLYDYIFVGGGCAAYSMLCRMLEHDHLKHKHILVIDKSDKTINDRTWSYWSRQQDIFDHLAIKKWQQFELGYLGKTINIDLHPYSYYTIRGIDFYNYCKQQFKQFNNITFINASVNKVSSENDTGFVKTDNETYNGKIIFNSILNTNFIEHSSAQFIWQHFLGYVVETTNDSFNDNTVTWMDFNVPQQNGATFMYVLPFTKRKALVEYTIFSEELLPHQIYIEQIEAYLSKKNITSYEVSEIECDKIPMTTYKFPRQKNNIVNIGIKGGAGRASTGFTFAGIQKQSKFIVAQLAKNDNVSYKYDFQEKKHLVYDKTFLHLLIHKKLSADIIFGQLFEKNPIDRVLKFINGETNIWEEIKLMNTVQKRKFIPAFLKEFLQ